MINKKKLSKEEMLRLIESYGRACAAHAFAGMECEEEAELIRRDMNRLHTKVINALAEVYGNDN